MSKLNEKILEFRENVGQSIAGLALLMKMDPDDYAELEKEWIPPDEILKRLCSLFEWNFLEIKKLADNSPSKNKKNNNSELNSSPSIKKNVDDSDVALFSKMIVEARNEVKQDEIGIATLMGISVEYYREIEKGFLPPNDLIRKICTLFGWNYKQIKQKINAQSTIQFDNRQPIIDPSEIKKSFSSHETKFNLDFEPPIPLYELIQEYFTDYRDKGLHIHNDIIQVLIEVLGVWYGNFETTRTKSEVMKDFQILRKAFVQRALENKSLPKEEVYTPETTRSKDVPF